MHYLEWGYYRTTANTTGLSEINVGGFHPTTVLKLQTDQPVFYTFQPLSASASLGKILAVEKIITNDPTVSNTLLGKFTVQTEAQLNNFQDYMPFQVEDINDSNAVLGTGIVIPYSSKRSSAQSRVSDNGFVFYAALSADIFSSIAVGASLGDEIHPCDPNATSKVGTLLRADLDQCVLVPSYCRSQGRLVFQKASTNAQVTVSVGRIA